MEENREILQLLRKIERSNRIRTVILIIMCLLMLAAAAGCVFLCLMIADLLPQVDGVLHQMQTILEDLEKTSEELSRLDLQTMVTDVDALVRYAQESLAATMDKLDTIDLEKLNQAIGDLAEIIEPLANFVRRFGG